VPRGTTGDSDIAKEGKKNGKKHNVTNDEADAAPQPHAPSEAEEVPEGRKESRRQGRDGARQGENHCRKKSERVGHLAPPWAGRLTVKLRGRTTTPDERRGRTLSSRARGAEPLTPHGPLQRLLGAAAGKA